MDYKDSVHIPNSDERVTPGWHDLDYTPTPFNKSIETEAVEGRETCFTGQLPRDWCTASQSAHGGWCTGLFLATSRKYFQTKHPDRSQNDPVHIHTQFLNPLTAGAIFVALRELKLGSRRSVIEITLQRSESSPIVAIALITMGDLSAKDMGPSIPTPPIKITDRRDCQRWTDALFYYTDPTSRECRTYTPKGGPSPLWSPVLGQHARDQWVKLDDEERQFDIPSVGFVVDMVIPTPLNYQKEALRGFMKYSFQTVSLALEFKRDPKGIEWLLSRISTDKISNGTYDMDIKVLDDTGDLVATCKHVCLMTPRSLLGKKGKAKAAL
ncbi:hypothetical protein AJ80_05965 [Polytolypa hystricis UAMH7299]|uniref:Thioesterase domain-containing protein n=1 Tax=Polytolypa hystricis (strain UAMH7299) TaxID=1447883 RepID=A0A2B7XZL5_POLH7|nr:hypothetical protein AJ80_05965 [Polytolypa hystricis UAMH7299]